MPIRKKDSDFSSFFSKYPEVELAYQFGSSVKQQDRTPQDIDIALLLQENVSAERRLEILSELADLLSKLLKKKADLSILNSAGPIFAYQVLKYGRLVYGDHKQASDFTVKTLTRYFDYLPLHQFFLDRLEERLGVTSHGR